MVLFLLGEGQVERSIELRTGVKRLSLLGERYEARVASLLKSVKSKNPELGRRK
jgi:hypothetical protein